MSQDSQATNNQNSENSPNNSSLSSTTERVFPECVRLIEGQPPYAVFVSNRLDVALISKVSPPRAEHWNNPFSMGWSDDPDSLQQYWLLTPEYLDQLRSLGYSHYTKEKALEFKSVLETYWNKK